MKSILKLSILALVFIGSSCKKDDVTTPVDPIDTDAAFTTTIKYNSLDAVEITADHYHVGKDKPVIVMCHQASYSRGEYQEIAVTLNSLGFNCIAIDQRSGSGVNGVVNQTYISATAAGLPTSYTDSKQDITASISWAKAYYNKDVILLGSSYSASLSLIIANENADVEQVLVFSPGEYLSGINVQTEVTGLNKPAFLTSAKAEAPGVTNLYNVISSTDKVQYTPSGAGRHGASALWTTEPHHAEYLTAVKSFLGV